MTNKRKPDKDTLVRLATFEELREKMTIVNNIYITNQYVSRYIIVVYYNRIE